MQAVRTLDLAIDDLTYPRLLARQARRNGDKTYLTFEGRTFGYAEVDALTNRLANGLLRVGVAPGDRVSLLTENAPQTLWTNFALGKIGAVSCPINTAAKGELLAYFLTLSESVAVVVSASLVERLAEVLERAPRVARVVVVDDGPVPGTAAPCPAGVRARVHAYDELERSPADAPGIDVGPHDAQMIQYTSGTTGPSKGVIATHAQCFGFSRGRVEYLGLWPDDVVYTCLPLFHGNALGAASIPALLADASLALSRRFSASAFWDDVRRHGATQFNLLSSMTNILWGLPPSELDRAHRVRQCTMVPVPAFAPPGCPSWPPCASALSPLGWGFGNSIAPKRSANANPHWTRRRPCRPLNWGARPSFSPIGGSGSADASMSSSGYTWTTASIKVVRATTSSFPWLMQAGRYW